MTDQSGLADWRAIWELKARYCRLLDTKQWTSWAALFTEDVEMDFADDGALAPFRGREIAVARVVEQLANAVTAHHVHSPEISVDGDTAKVIWAMQDRVLNVGSAGMCMMGFGHYHEHLARSADGWRIARLKLTRLHLDFDESSGELARAR